MPRRAQAAVAAALVVLAGCGGTSDRDAVRDYVDRANAIQEQAAPDLAAANAAYARLSRGKLKAPAAVARVQDVAGRLGELRDRLAALDAPSAASELDRRLLAVYDRTIDLAEEVGQLGAYQPAAGRAVTALGAAGRRLQRALVGSDADGQEAALRAYGERLAAIEGRLRALSPPELLVAAHRAQLLRIASARTLTRRLRAAVAAADGPLVSRLLVRFQDVYAETGDDRSVQRAALRAYRERLLSINEAVGRVREEQARLERTLG
jgi:hypothetical protein